MNSNRRGNWVVPVGIGCAVILICLCVVGGGAWFFLLRPVDTSSFSSSSDEQAVPTEQVLNSAPPTQQIPEEAAPPDSQAPTIAPANTEVPQPTEEVFNGTGEQAVGDHYYFDDFSSDYFDWPILDQDAILTQYKDEAYSFSITAADSFDWIYVPAPEIPNAIEFDAWSATEDVGGAWGVVCQYQDETNYYYVEFNLLDNQYVIGKVVNDELEGLTELNDKGQYWYPANQNDDPTAPDHYLIDCTLDSISVTVNGQWLNTVSVPNPFASPGETVFYVYTDPWATNGYEMLFDNVTVYWP